ncbi:hypothetical protein EGW08_018661 [Elysia chlorotica]|uniref:RNase H type-1 domain-containing protein n=1 Tax=Elysia chlorotica TaxID=188477 RepID=A0A3S1BS16_ELYCH|nr:hypothetical protein EGW08_018661 [Elysia chlorotica]
MESSTRFLEVSTTISGWWAALLYGSKKGSIVSLGVYSKDLDLKINKRITDNNSTTAAELAAIDEAIKTIQEKKIESENIVILTDSLAATISIKNPNKTNARQDLTESINIRANDLQEKNQTQVQICWIPAHCNIEGNEKADKQAKLGLSSKTRRKTGLGPSEVKSIINQYKNKMWQDMWTNNPKGRFFHAIAPQVGGDEGSLALVIGHQGTGGDEGSVALVIGHQGTGGDEGSVALVIGHQGTGGDEGSVALVIGHQGTGGDEGSVALVIGHQGTGGDEGSVALVIGHQGTGGDEGSLALVIGHQGTGGDEGSLALVIGHQGTGGDEGSVALVIGHQGTGGDEGSLALVIGHQGTGGDEGSVALVIGHQGTGGDEGSLALVIGHQGTGGVGSKVG